MRRTELYLEDALWSVLHARAELDGTTISDLVSVAVRERYMGDSEDRQKAMMGVVGLWKDREDLPDTESYLRSIRGDNRMQRLGLE